MIINLASIASIVGIKDRFAYGMTKGAVLTMTYSIATDYMHKGIRFHKKNVAKMEEKCGKNA